jgi:hypothetical protein
VAGFLSCTDKKAKDLSKPAKLPDDLLRGEDAVGARVRDHIKGAYAWPIALSYAVRNWFVHDGYANSSVELFKFDAPDPGPFELRDDAWQSILAKCTGSYAAQDTQTRLPTPPDIRSDLLEGLETCHAEVDEVMSFVLLWATGSTKLQVNFLFGRDSIGSTPPKLPAPTSKPIRRYKNFSPL